MSCRGGPGNNGRMLRATFGIAVAALVLLGAGGDVHAQPQGGAGRRVFETRCAVCHGNDGHGGDTGPSIVYRLPLLKDAELIALLQGGRPAKGMPPQPMPVADRTALIRYLRGIERREPPLTRATIQTTDGRTLDGVVLNQGFSDLQLRTDDKRVHLLRRSGAQFRPIASEARLADLQRRSRRQPLHDADADREDDRRPAGAGVAVQRPGRRHPAGHAGRRGRHHVRDRAERVLRARRRQRPPDLALRAVAHARPDVGGGANRGVAVAGDRVFMVTDHAHLIALNRFTGELLWDSVMDDWRKNYAASSAPLTAGNLVISGVTGGEHGANGFVVAFDQDTGKEAWRFWTVPKPGTPGSETWTGKDIAHGGAPTWFTGSYDPELDLVYWPTGNPGKEYNGDDRQGDNLYASASSPSIARPAR